MLAFVILTLGDILTTSPTSDELPHLASGYTYLTTRDFRLNDEHPPLLKEFAALAILNQHLWRSQLDPFWRSALEVPNAQWRFAHEMFYGRRPEYAETPTTVRIPRSAFFNDAEALFTRARIAMLFFPLLLAIVIFAWAGEVWGWWGGAVAIVLFAFDPNFIAHGGLITTDVGVAALMAATLYFFWRCSRNASGINIAAFAICFALAIVIFAWAGGVWGWWGGAVAIALFAFDPNFIAHGGLITTDVGVAALMAATLYFFWRCSRNASVINIAAFAICFALAIVAKFSALLLIPMVLILFFHARSRRMLIAIGCAAAATIIVVWAAYGFRYSASSERPRPLVMVVNDWYAARSLLAQYPDGPPESAIQRARSTIHIGTLGRMVLFANDLHVFPEAYLYGLALQQRNAYARWSYLDGEGSHSGFPTYFLYTFIYKTPEATIALIVLAVFGLRRRRTSALPFLIWPIVIYMAFSITSNLNIGHRHILPIYPFLYVAAGSLNIRRRWWVSTIAAILVALPACMVWGKHLSYMNLIAGGPRHGYQKLIDSNFDWGQDLKRLGKWAEHRTEPVNLVYFGTADPRFYGIPYRNLPYGYGMDPVMQPDLTSHDFAISASALMGVNADVEPARHYWQQFLAEHHARQVDQAGYSILIYRIE